MDTNIKKWILTARKISQYLLNTPDRKNQQETEAWKKSAPLHEKIIHDLSNPQLYLEKSDLKQQLDEKYTYDKFIRAYRQKKHRKIQQISYAASISLLLLVGGTCWFYLSQSEQLPTPIAANFTPGSKKASLILENGEEIVLKDQQTITEKDGTIIQNSEEEGLAYKKAVKNTTIIHYNTLRIPRGGEYHLILADGTKIWLNSESELTYPTQFTSTTREVSLKGEAYFEIAHNKEKPFYVNSIDIQVQATGTAFNVMAYKNENNLQVTLTEGGVNIEKDQQIISKLTPNLQFSINKENGKFIVQTVDPRVATAWKNGMFFFENEPLNSIIRKLSRWYEAELECNDTNLQHYKFSGEIRKYENIIKVLDMLKLTNEITYKIEENHKIKIYSTE